MANQGPSFISYLEAYQKKKIELESKGLKMAADPFDANTFKFAYAVERERMKQLVLEGKRKVKGNITQNLVSVQAYKQSLHQLRSLKFAYEQETGEKISIKSLREDSEKAVKFYDRIKERYYELKGQGYRGKDAGKEISREFHFAKHHIGSP